MNTRLCVKFACILISATVISPELASARKVTTKQIGTISRLTMSNYCNRVGGIADGVKATTGPYGCAPPTGCSLGCTAKGVCTQTCIQN